MLSTITVIASAFRADANLLTNHKNHTAAQELLNAKGFATSVAVGSWKEEGQERASEELSLVISATWDELNGLKALFLERFKQDAILVIDEMESRLASLAMNDGAVIPLGCFQVISEEEALASECYTYLDGEYYLAKEAA